MTGINPGGEKPPILDPMTLERAVRIDYVNWKGVRAWRSILPIRWWFGSNPDYHPTPQWLLHAWDLERNNYRDFAMTGIKAWLAPGDNAED